MSRSSTPSSAAPPGMGHNVQAETTTAPRMSDDLFTKIHRAGLVLKAVDALLFSCLEDAAGNPLADDLEMLKELVEVGRSHLREAENGTE